MKDLPRIAGWPTQTGFVKEKKDRPKKRRSRKNNSSKHKGI
jgi:hypothetical protein